MFFFFKKETVLLKETKDTYSVSCTFFPVIRGNFSQFLPKGEGGNVYLTLTGSPPPLLDAEELFLQRMVGGLVLLFNSSSMFSLPVNQPEKIDQSDSFLPTRVLACETQIFFTCWLNE